LEEGSRCGGESKSVSREASERLDLMGVGRIPLDMMELMEVVDWCRE